MICLLLFGLQAIIPSINQVQGKQTTNSFINNAISTNVGTDKEAFLSSWNTSITGTGSSNGNQIMLPLTQNGTYNFTVQWGDNSESNITSYNQVEVTHTYVNPGIYNLNITGLLDGWSFGNSAIHTSGDSNKLLEISQWGNLQFGNSSYYFSGATNLNLTATDAPNLNGTTNLSEAFYNCHNIGSSGSMDNWDVSHVTNMQGMFWDAYSFNQPLGNWNVSQVTGMNYMFYLASAFNQPLGTWDVSHVTNMQGMFSGNGPYTNSNDYTVFNKSIGDWNVSKVKDMSFMFASDSVFNQSISNWNVSQVTSMRGMFQFATAFNQPLGNWDVSQVRDMSYMFTKDTAFNQPLGKWVVSKAYSMLYMFDYDVLSVSNYDNLLMSWAKLPLQFNVGLYVYISQYSLKALPSRQFLIDHFHWIISDGGLIPTPQSPWYLQISTGNHTVNLSWKAPANYDPTYQVPPPVNGYYIYRSENKSSGFVLIKTTTKLYFNDTGLTNKVTYYYKVQAFNNITFGYNSTVMSGTPINRTTSSIYPYRTNSISTTSLNTSIIASPIPDSPVILPVLLITLFIGTAFGIYFNKKINDSRK